jgi:aminoglycoside/choline kinase family phosphotransferase
MKSSDELIEFARESLGLSRGCETELLALEASGSARSYFRFKWDQKHSVILVDYDSSRLENTYYADISKFLCDIGIPVPEILRHEPADCLIIMRDLGSVNLWSRRNAPWRIRKPLYLKVLQVIHRLHSFPRQRFPSSNLKLAEPFGPALYQWERTYFLDNFIERFCGIELRKDQKKQIEAELSHLAQTLSENTTHLVHRDLQSQNVMICGGEPYLIDFQGMRFGTRFYDLGSLLYDPYVTISEQERESLLLFYYRLSKHDLDWDSFQNWFWNASVQRLIQALGAYSFLGLTKRLSKYLNHIPAGLRNLCSAAESAALFPGLLELCAECSKIIGDFGIHGVLGDFEVSSRRFEDSN